MKKKLFTIQLTEDSSQSKPSSAQKQLLISFFFSSVGCSSRDTRSMKTREQVNEAQQVTIKQVNLEQKRTAGQLLEAPRPGVFSLVKIAGHLKIETCGTFCAHCELVRNMKWTPKRHDGHCSPRHESVILEQPLAPPGKLQATKSATEGDRGRT
jgi:predicted XRE-type DNA-binding protein